MNVGVNVAVFDAQGRVLLTQREDFEVWCLPGGSVDAGESLAQAAVREVREETGIAVRLTRLVGTYSRPAWRDGYHVLLFAGEPVGGELAGQPGEVIALGYYALDALPGPLLVGQRQRILDAAAGVGGSAVITESVAFPTELPADYAGLRAAQAQSGLGRREFYARYIAGAEHAPSTTDVEDVRRGPSML